MKIPLNRLSYEPRMSVYMMVLKLKLKLTLVFDQCEFERVSYLVLEPLV